ncbi:hypothetical protein QVE09_13610 [Paenibacillus sp. ClWae2A]|uniref:hypothetical protein n=1 Tax=Paenibacillus sp. ClWae2A TaxID=3057177 RepID=UPI0028F68F60|nr:hypothetical protein [Paenibacillus sp. ClWae2A]MDT9719947.1 hypothetical protein [Paenibacillus sp. ClWae2A]
MNPQEMALITIDKFITQKEVQTFGFLRFVPYVSIALSHINPPSFIEKIKYGDRSYSIVFRNAKGKTVSAYAGGAPSSVTEMLNDSNQFFSSDPYKKYKWSQSTWNKIIAGEVALGSFRVS